MSPGTGTTGLDTNSYPHMHAQGEIHSELLQAVMKAADRATRALDTSSTSAEADTECKLLFASLLETVLGIMAEDKKYSR